MIDIDFIVLGAQKCATTWMFDALKEHPGIAMPRKKRETHYIGSPWFREVGPDAYMDKFATPGSDLVVGDISVDYLFDANAAAAVEKHVARPRFIVCLRDPVQRAVSAYAWLLRKGVLDDRDVNATFERALRKDSEGVESELLARGYYGTQCARFLERFDPDSFLVIDFNQIAERPEHVYQAMLRHVGADASIRPDALRRAPKKNSHMAALWRIQRLAPESSVMGKVMDHAHQCVSRLGLATAAPALSEDIAGDLRGRFRSDVEHLDALLRDVPEEQRLVDQSFRHAWAY